MRGRNNIDYHRLSYPHRFYFCGILPPIPLSHYEKLPLVTARRKVVGNMDCEFERVDFLWLNIICDEYRVLAKNWLKLLEHSPMDIG